MTNTKNKTAANRTERAAGKPKQPVGGMGSAEKQNAPVSEFEKKWNLDIEAAQKVVDLKNQISLLGVYKPELASACLHKAVELIAIKNFEAPVCGLFKQEDLQRYIVFRKKQLEDELVAILEPQKPQRFIEPACLVKQPDALVEVTPKNIPSLYSEILNLPVVLLALAAFLAGGYVL